ncbi:MAG: AraC family transcriptional regulator [Pseudomonadales bacterium]
MSMTSLVRSTARLTLLSALFLSPSWALAEDAASPNADAGPNTASTANSAVEAVIAGELAADKTSASAGPVDGNLEQVKKSLLQLKRDLVILEEDLLFPASSQVAVYLSMDLGAFFALDAVTLKLNGKEVHHHLYTEKQVDALFRGAVQKLFVGNAKQGNNRVTAFFTGRGPSGRDFKRATTVEFEKSFEPTYIELAVSDSESNYQPDFSATVSD